MKLFGRVYIVVIFSQLLFAAPAFDDTYFSISARSLALGISGTAQVQGIGSAYLNPANIFSKKYRTQIYHSSDRSFEDQQNYNFALVQAVDERFALGFTLIGSQISDIPRVEKIDDRPQVLYNSSSVRTTIMTTVAWRPAEYLLVGSNLKIYQISIFDERAHGNAVDLGVNYHILPELNVGFNWRNVINSGLHWTSGVTDPLEEQKQLGLSWQSNIWSKKYFVNLDLNFVEEIGRLQPGIEFWLTEKVAMRSGRSSEQWHFGLGIIVENIQLDYVLSSHDYLSNSHKISLSAGF